MYKLFIVYFDNKSTMLSINITTLMLYYMYYYT